MTDSAQPAGPFFNTRARDINVYVEVGKRETFRKFRAQIVITGPRACAYIYIVCALDFTINRYFQCFNVVARYALILAVVIFSFALLGYCVFGSQVRWGNELNRSRTRRNPIGRV